MTRASTLKAQSFVEHQVAVIKHKVPVSPSISPKHTGLRQKQTSHASLPFSTLLLSPGICFIFVVAINSPPEASDYCSVSGMDLLALKRV